MIFLIVILVVLFAIFIVSIFLTHPANNGKEALQQPHYKDDLNVFNDAVAKLRNDDENSSKATKTSSEKSEEDKPEDIKMAVDVFSKELLVSCETGEVVNFAKVNRPSKEAIFESGKQASMHHFPKDLDL